MSLFPGRQGRRKQQAYRPGLPHCITTHRSRTAIRAGMETPLPGSSPRGEQDSVGGTGVGSELKPESEPPPP